MLRNFFAIFVMGVAGFMTTLVASRDKYAMKAMAYLKEQWQASLRYLVDHWLGFGVLLCGVAFSVVDGSHPVIKFLNGLGPEFIGISVGVLVIEYWNKSRQDAQLKAELISDLGGSDNSFALRAFRRIRDSEWLDLDEMLREADLFRANLSGADLSDVDLSGKNLLEIVLSNNTILNGANLTKAVMNKANLTDAKLIGADLTGAKLNKANLSQANLFGAKLFKAELRKANLSEANLSGKVNMSGADLYGADLSQANLNQANLRGADLREANLNEADLFRADLRDAYLGGAKLSGAKLTETKLTNAKLDRLISMFSSGQAKVRVVDEKIDQAGGKQVAPNKNKKK